MLRQIKIDLVTETAHTNLSLQTNPFGGCQLHSHWAGAWMQQEKDQKAFEYLENEVLQPDETLAWTGRPNPKDGALAGVLSNYFQGLANVAFGGFMTYIGLEMESLFGFVGLGFIGYGVWEVALPVRNYLRAGRAYYAITTKRVLILEIGSSTKVTSLVGTDITNYERTDKGNDTGSIRLRKTLKYKDRSWLTSVLFTDGLWGITDVKGAAEAIAVVRE
jgi:hypothetical protein